MEQQTELSGPWRATRLWNDIIRTMRTGLPVKKQKKNMKTYEDCIGSSELIDWLHKSLQKNVNFGSDVTREQTVQLLKKLYRAGILENVRQEDMGEFKESGELYRLSNKSPVKVLRTPGKSERRVLGDLGNTPRINKDEDKVTEEEKKKSRSKSLVRRAKEEQVKKQLNLNYIQSLPSNYLIILDNEGTWRKVYCNQLAGSLSTHHVQLLEKTGLLNMDIVMHNMTRVSGKGIVQLEERGDDLPHWVLSAMKCLANWPRQLRTVNGKESCLPSYPGFEHDVFNVVKDYFLGLPEPLTTFSLFDYFMDAWVKAEALTASLTLPPVHVIPPPPPPGCQHPGSENKPCSRPYIVTDLDSPRTTESCCTEPCSINPYTMEQCSLNPRVLNPSSQFYTMSEEGSEDFLMLSNQERVAKIRQTFSVLPPLATSSVKGDHSNSTNLTTSSSLSPDMSTTAIMSSFLPPNTCFETVFIDSSPVTRIVPQAQSEVLHLSRSPSGRSLSHISSGSWPTRCSATQTDAARTESVRTNSLKRIPRWKRSSRLRKSVAVMEQSPEGIEGRIGRDDVFISSHGKDNGGFSSSPSDDEGLSTRGRGRVLSSASELPSHHPEPSLRHTHSLDNLLDREMDRKQFLLKYRQVSGDLRSGTDLVAQSRKDSSVIMSKTVRKEKRKSRARDVSSDLCGLTPSMNRLHIKPRDDPPYCYDNPGLDQSPRAPLASQECDLSPVQAPFSRHHQYNSSYRIATLHPNPGLPRTSTKLSLPKPRPPPRRLPHQPLKRNDHQPNMEQEDVYTLAGPGPLRRYSAPRQSGRYNGLLIPCPVEPEDASFIPRQLRRRNGGDGFFSRGSEARASMYSQGTVDSGRYSLPPCPTYDELKTVQADQPLPEALGMFKLLALLVPPANRRKLQLLLKFILKISMNPELKLDNSMSNASLSLDTFLEVVLRPRDLTYPHKDIARPILQFFLDHYDCVWTPPQDLRREVEEAVYQSLVNKRLAAGEDPHPVTYCKQVTMQEYATQSHYGSQNALNDLLGAILEDTKMSDKQKRKKLIKFKEAYPDMWRSRFSSMDEEPEIMTKKISGPTSLSRLKSAIGM